MNRTDDSDRLGQPELPVEVRDVRERYGVESALIHLDPDEPLEVLLHERLRSDPHHAARLATSWAALTAAAGDDDDAFVRAFRPLGPLPAGRSWTSWARYVSTLLPRIPRGGRDFPAHSGRPEGHPLAFGASRFLDTGTANRATTEVLRRHEAAFRRWCDDPAGRPRLHLYADLGRPVGGRPDSGPGAPGALPGCAVVMSRTGDGQPFIVTSYPEPALPEEPRRRWPDLPDLLGAYFGQDLHDLDRTTWAAERGFALASGPAVRSAMARQLAELVITPDDEALRASVVALGSYVVPDELRRWLHGLARRLTELYDG